MPKVSSTKSPSPDLGDNVSECRTALFVTTWPEESTATVAIDGELDAANGAQFVEFALRNSAEMERLIVDLTGLSFFATAGFASLHTVNVQCVKNNIRWAVVPSPAVQRLLRICDPDSALPVCADVDAALATVHTDPPRLLELVPEPR